MIHMNFMDRIKSLYEQQSRVRKTISDYMLSHLLQCSFLSLKEFSQATGVTEATVISYCKSIGFDSYMEMKKDLQNYIMTEYSAGERISVLASRSTNFEELFKSVENSEIRLLKDLFIHNDPGHLKKILYRIVHAGCIYTAAHNMSHLVADYLTRRLKTLGCISISLDLQDISRSLELLSTGHQQDNLLIAITMTPYGKETLALAELCRKTGIPVIAITDSKYSPIVQSADEILLVPTELLGLTNSLSAVFALVELITILTQFELQQSGRSETENRLDVLSGLYNRLLSDLK